MVRKIRALGAFAACAVATAAYAAPVRFVTFNIDGLPAIQGFQPDRTAEFNLMAPLVEGIHADGTPTVVSTQELFNQPYYATITNPSTVTYPEITAKDNGGPNGIGDGLTLLSDVTIASFTRVQWTDCFGTGGLAGSDCDTNKGYLFARVVLAPGAELHIYDLHADAGQDTNSRAARAANLAQLSSAIQANSAGQAVIVLGDTNSVYTRSTDAIGAFAAGLGLKDAWVETALGGATPGFGGTLNNAGCPPPRGSATGSAIDASGATCEVVDKILYRGSVLVQVSLLDYEVLLNFVDGANVPLSDHLPVTAKFDIALVPEPTLAVLLVVAAGVVGVRRRA